jgi:hypothetical protein
MSRGGEDGFLSRWSRLKRDGAPEEAEAAPEAEPEVEAEAAPEFDPAELPDPDSLGAGDDFTVFLKDRVPEELRRRALRRLWRSNPVLACVDGLNDYDGDFTGGTVPRGELKTAYEVGRGMVREVARRATEAAPDPAPETPEPAPAPKDAAPPPPPEQPPQDVAEAGPEAPPEDDLPRPRRRMRFEFSEKG